MALGVPYIAVLANVLLTLELFLVTRNLLSLLTVVPLHALAWIVCLSEPRYFELVRVFISTRRRAGFVRRGRWKVVSYGPFPGNSRDASTLVMPVGLGGGA
jgi:type IV secretion system protein VirB3